MTDIANPPPMPPPVSDRPLPQGGPADIDGAAAVGDIGDDPTEPFRPDPELAAGVAIMGLQSYCDALRQALDARDARRVEISAGVLTNAWIVAHALVGILKARAQTRPEERELAQIAARALDAALDARHQLFERARTHVDAPALQSALECCELRLQLAVARDRGGARVHGVIEAARKLNRPIRI